MREGWLGDRDVHDLARQAVDLLYPPVFRCRAAGGGGVDVAATHSACSVPLSHSHEMASTKAWSSASISLSAMAASRCRTAATRVAVFFGSAIRASADVLLPNPVRGHRLQPGGWDAAYLYPPSAQTGDLLGPLQRLHHRQAGTAPRRLQPRANSHAAQAPSTPGHNAETIKDEDGTKDPG